MYDQYQPVWSKMAETTKNIQLLRQKCEISKACANEFLSDLQNNESPSLELLLESVDDIKNNIKIAINGIMVHLNEWKRSSVKADEQLIGSYAEVEESNIWNQTGIWQCDPILLQHGGQIPLDTLDHIQVSFPTLFLYIQSFYYKEVYF